MPTTKRSRAASGQPLSGKATVDSTFKADGMTKLVVGDASILAPSCMLEEMIGSQVNVVWTFEESANVGVTKDDPKDGIVLSGLVFRSTDDCCLVSCGGIIVELPVTSTPLTTAVRVHISSNMNRSTRGRALPALDAA